MRLLLLDAAAGILLLAAISVLATRKRASSGSLRTLGWLLIAVPLPVAVSLHVVGALAQTADQIAFLTGVCAFAAGAALVLGADDEDDWHRDSDGDSPPWWPEFEREFRAYERSRRTLVRT